MGSPRKSGQIKSQEPPSPQRCESRGEKTKSRKSNPFACNLFLITHKHDLLVTKAQLSQAGSFQLPPKNTSEVIPSKAQNPEIKRGSKSPVTGLARPKGCVSGRLQLALKQRGKEQNGFSKELGRAGHGHEKTIRMETKLSSPPHCSLLPLSLQGPALVCPAGQGMGGGRWGLLFGFRFSLAF